MPQNGFIYEAWMDMMENSGHCHYIEIRHATNNKRDSGGAPGLVGKFLYHRSIEIKEIPNN